MDKEEGIIEVLKSLDTWQVFTVVLIGIFLYFIFKTELLDKFLKAKSNKAEEKLKNEIERVKDEFAERAFKNIESAAHHSVESLEHCIGANYYVIHDSGEDLRNVEKWYLAVLRSTSFAIGTDYQEPVLINSGFRWLNEQARDKMFIYVPDAENEPNLKGIDGEYMSTMGIKSCALCLVKNETKVYHLVSLNFDVVNPKKINPNLRKTIFEFKRSVLSNI